MCATILGNLGVLIDFTIRHLASSLSGAQWLAVTAWRQNICENNGCCEAEWYTWTGLSVRELACEDWRTGGRVPQTPGVGVTGRKWRAVWRPQVDSGTRRRQGASQIIPHQGPRLHDRRVGSTVSCPRDLETTSDVIGSGSLSTGSQHHTNIPPACWPQGRLIQCNSLLGRYTCVGVCERER